MWHTIHNDSEPFTYLSEAAAESSQTFCLDTYLAELARSKHSPADPSCSDKGTASSPPSLSGTTSARLTGDSGAALSTLSRVASLVSTSAAQGAARGSAASGVASGRKCSELSARYDLATHSWKTHLWLWDEVLQLSSVTLPKSGMTSGGMCWEVMKSAGPTTASDFGDWLPTPCASDNRDRGDVSNPCISRRQTIGKQIGLSMYFKGAPCPMCVERIMGWPMGWTGLQPLEMARIQEWQLAPGRF